MEPMAEEIAPRVSIHGRIYELPDLWDRGDDWTGVTSTAERKRRQNRLNQRAYRRRRKAHGSAGVPSESVSPASVTASPAEPVLDNREVPPGQIIQYEDAGSLLMTSPFKAARVRDSIRQAYHDHMLHAPRPESLQMLIRLNLLNAIARNAIRMGFLVEGLCRDEYISPFNSYGPYLPGSTSALAPFCPASLQPTALQRTVRHHPWLDLFPFPAFRDNILRVLDAGLFDDDELCVDVLEVWCEDVESRPSLMIWGESWDAHAWEASPSFLRKWGWLLEDCPEIFEATNYWREKRGQKRLVYPNQEDSIQEA